MAKLPEKNANHQTGVGLDHWGCEFPTTHWSLLVSSDQGGNVNTERAVSEIASGYWYPLYAFLRRSGHSAYDAQDHTQGFFAYLLTGDRLNGLDAAKGRFRSYFLGAVNHYLSNVRSRASAQKRGGGMVLVSIEQENAEERLHNEPSDEGLTPEKLFDRQWALAVFGQAMDALRKEYAGKGKTAIFESLKIYLSGEGERGAYKRIAEELKVSEVNVRSMVSRLRSRYRLLLRQQIETTLESSEDVEDELDLLFAAVSGRCE